MSDGSQGTVPIVVVPATPTTNGGLHVGHIAGPYLAADVFTRYQRACGRLVVHTTCTDDSQSYVVTTAARSGVSPEELCARATGDIQWGLDVVGSTLTAMPPIDAHYRDAVITFLTALHDAGAFERRTVRFPFAMNAGVHLYDGLVSGRCPTCLQPSSGGVCEACGHPNNFDELLDPRYTLDPDDEIRPRELDILVFPLERWRRPLTEYYAERLACWRPRARALVEDLLARPLPEVPVTVAGTWGIPAPFPDTHGQIVYPWLEAMPAVRHAAAWTARREGVPDDARQPPELVFFHGYDNVFHWSVLDVALLLAHGGQPPPSTTIVNEFYELEREKVSTSRNHLVTATELFEKVPRDLARYYLTLTAPETARSNFTFADVTHVTSRLVDAWDRVAERLAASAPAPGTPVLVPASGRRAAHLMADRFRNHYRPDRFSPAAVSEALLAHLTRLGEPARGDDPGDLLLQLRTLLAFAAPVLVDVTADLGDGVDLRLDECGGPTEVVPAFRLPALGRRPAATPVVTTIGMR